MGHPKIAAQLQSEDPIVVEKALVAAREFIKSAWGRAAALQADIVVPLVTLTTSPESSKRILSAEDLGLIGVTELGVHSLVQHRAVEALDALLDDADPAVQVAALRALVKCGWHDDIRTRLVMIETPVKLVNKAFVDDDLRCRLELKVLRHILSTRQNTAAVEQCLSSDGLTTSGNAVDLCMKVLSRQRGIAAGSKLGTNPAAVATADAEGEIEEFENGAAVLTMLCAHEKARQQSVDVGLVPALVRLMHMPHLHARFSCTEACAAILVLKVGKDAFVECGGCDALYRVLPIAYAPLRLVVLNAITLAAEHPVGRYKLMAQRPVMSMLEKLRATSTDPVIIEAIAEAIRQVSFNHQPQQLKPGADSLLSPREVKKVYGTLEDSNKRLTEPIVPMLKVALSEDQE